MQAQWRCPPWNEDLQLSSHSYVEKTKVLTSQDLFLHKAWSYDLSTFKATATSDAVVVFRHTNPGKGRQKGENTAGGFNSLPSRFCQHPSRTVQQKTKPVCGTYPAGDAKPLSRSLCLLPDSTSSLLAAAIEKGDRARTKLPLYGGRVHPALKQRRRSTG